MINKQKVPKNSDLEGRAKTYLLPSIIYFLFSLRSSANEFFPDFKEGFG